MVIQNRCLCYENGTQQIKCSILTVFVVGNRSKIDLMVKGDLETSAKQINECYSYNRID